MREILIKDYIEVGNRLDELGTSREMLLEVVDAMVSARSECTDDDPSGSRGWRGWQMGTRRLRQIHNGVEDWENDNTNQIASISSKLFGLKVVVCNTDDGTCVENSKPKNRSEKGAATDRNVTINDMQTSFFDEDGFEPIVAKILEFPKPELEAESLTYTLCVFHDEDDIRAEFSCATKTENGYYSKFGERIFLIGGDAGKPVPVKRKEADDETDTVYDVPVKRKK